MMEGPMKLRFNAINLAISLILLASYAATPAAQTQDNALPHIYVFGEVNSPGVYAIRSPLTMPRALISAGGLPKEATGRDTIIFRKPSGGGKLQMIKVDVWAVMHGETKDVPLENDDVIIVNR